MLLSHLTPLTVSTTSRVCFYCDDGTCINANEQCDGVAHCSEGEDEAGCFSTGDYIQILIK